MAFSTEGCSARFRPWAALSIFDCGRHFILSTEGGNVHSTVGGILHFRPRAALMFSIQGCNVHSTQGGTVHSTEFCFPVLGYMNTVEFANAAFGRNGTLQPLVEMSVQPTIAIAECVPWSKSCNAAHSRNCVLQPSVENACCSLQSKITLQPPVEI